MTKRSDQREAQVPEAIVPSCPPEIGPLARTEWNRVVAELVRLDRLTHLDRVPLTIYCVAYEQYIEGIAALGKFGAMIKSPSGYPIQSPYVSHVNRQVDIMMKIASEFGFTPASRTKIWPEKSRMYTYDSVTGAEIEM